MCQKGPAYIFVAGQLIFSQVRGVLWCANAKFCNHSAEKRGFSIKEQRVFFHLPFVVQE
jgi:hypothetical protein